MIFTPEELGQQVSYVSDDAFVFANANKRTAFFVLVKFLQLNGYRFSVTVEEAVKMCVTIAVEALTDEKMTSYSKWVSEHSVREKVKK
ncbi:type II toxin-antitoxin system death-on-curing family toxin [Streptococcus pneumoniae]|uniref:type II toxin-antitoxin system death-on-curing family toxin n=1 Tax=Streptococcus pneumoniae TaxID=1313 RepID=UPI000993940A|nr:type II toxin-antitoxin system death-on-curing family toxin [Streptococcus pneumoniae]